VLADEPVDRIQVSLQGPKRRLFVAGHEAAVAHRIGAQDGGKPAFDDFGIHGRFLRDRSSPGERTIDREPRRGGTGTHGRAATGPVGFS
jgi:hypothetical protein